jgi:hypothetical protein
VGINTIESIKEIIIKYDTKQRQMMVCLIHQSSSGEREKESSMVHLRVRERETAAMAVPAALRTRSFMIGLIDRRTIHYSMIVKSYMKGIDDCCR